MSYRAENRPMAKLIGIFLQAPKATGRTTRYSPQITKKNRKVIPNRVSATGYADSASSVGWPSP